MRIRLTFILTFVLFQFITKAQLGETENWKGYTDYKVDTIVEGYRFIGEYKNKVKEGWWKVFYNNDLITKAFYQKDFVIQTEGIRDDIHYKIYSDEATNKQYTIRQNNEGKVFIRIEYADNNKQKVGEEVWFSNFNKILNDTSFGLKKIDDTTFVDRNNNRYSTTSSSIKISDQDLIDEQITINDEGNYILKRRTYKLYNNRTMNFRNGKLTNYQSFTPVYTWASRGKPKEPLKSVRKDIFIFNDGSTENAINYSVVIDNKPVLKGNINSNGQPTGIWDFYHFTYYDTEGEKRTAAFSAANLIEFSKLLQGDAPYINMFYFKDMPSLTASDLTNDVTSEYLNKIEKSFVSIDKPYLLTM